MAPKCTCASDRLWLRAKRRPAYEELPSPVRLVDLYCGCGGLSLGAAEAARRAGRGFKVVLAVDSDPATLGAYQLNFPGACTTGQPVEEMFDGDLGQAISKGEEAVARKAGRVDVLVAGPPCQGHSTLNNHTRGDDPRNDLYTRAARAAEVLRPAVVMIENVPSVVRDQKGVASESRGCLERAGYAAASDVLDLSRLGAPQRRRRHVLVALRQDLGASAPELIRGLNGGCPVHQTRSLRWGIDDLIGVVTAEGIDAPSRPSPANVKRIKWLFDHDAYDLPNRERPGCHHGTHKYVSMYGRLRWDEPSPTMTTGFGSMGQGRYVHPSERRTLTPHEAARLQMLPDFFRLPADAGRGVIATLIGNAAPPSLALSVVGAALPLMGTSRRRMADRGQRDAPVATPNASALAGRRALRPTGALA